MEVEQNPEQLAQTNYLGHYFRLTLVQLFWGGTFVASEVALVNQPPLTTAAVRYVLASLGYVLILYLSGSRPQVSLKTVILPLFLMGFFGVFLYHAFLYMGLQRTNAVSAALLIPTTQPIITTFLGTVIFRETLRWKQIIGLFMGSTGVAGVLTGTWALKSESQEVTGVLLILAAAAAFSIYSVFGKIALKHLSSLETTAYSSLIGTLFLLPLAFLEGGVTTLQHTNTLFWGNMGYLVVFATLLPYLWWQQSVRSLGVNRTAMFTLLMPPIAVFLAVVILKQNVTALQIIGSFVALAGVVIGSQININFWQKSK